MEKKNTNIYEELQRKQVLRDEVVKQEVGGVDLFADENLMRLSGLLG
jgi:hypothetical protein